MPKHQNIQDILIEGIRSGEFPPESRLPSERDLAERFGVSYLTARQAVAHLVEASLLERRARSGTFVRPHSRRRLATRTAYQLCSPEDNLLTRAFLRIGGQLIEEHGWRSQVIRLTDHDERTALRAVQSGDPVLVLGSTNREQLVTQAMQAAGGRAVIVANRMDDLGIPSVVADDAQALRLAITHLQAHGHHRIALLCDQPEHPITRVQIASWRDCCSTQNAPDDIVNFDEDDLLVSVRRGSYDCLPTTVYEVMKDFLASPRSAGMTAFICLVDEMIMPALAACRDAGRPVPEDLSVVGLGADNAQFAFANPSVTSVDVNITEHLRQALNIIDRAEAGQLDRADRLRLIEPQLIVRESVKPVFPA